ncbi:MAG: hypothetical protein EBZ09_11325 [Betaproteobacteria bacterium]|nr:hypothetical protein [Betaproteobacteria bacterium]
MVLFRWIRKPIGSASALSPETDQSYRRFHRRGLLAALGLHALLPVLLTAPAWVPALFESAVALRKYKFFFFLTNSFLFEKERLLLT